MALRIIGAGFGRTGTSSMKIALEHLGFGPCHHMFEVRDNPQLLPHWEKVADGQPQDWDEAFAGYRSQIDWPGARVWRELAGHYPDAKVILTVRDPDEWYDSMSATVIPFIEGRGTYPDAHANGISTMGLQTHHRAGVRRTLERSRSCHCGLQRPHRGGATHDPQGSPSHL